MEKLMDTTDAKIGEMADQPNLQPIADIYFTAAAQVSDDHEGQHLVGSECLGCGAVAFPARAFCMTCGARDLENAALPRAGSLYTFTTVHVSSSRPVPYTIGYVDLSNGVRVLANIRALAIELCPDLPVRLECAGDEWYFVPAGDRQ